MRADCLETLLAVQETGSLTAAAERRHLSQPAVTRQLQHLQGEVGVALLSRRGRGVVLTPAGQELAALAGRQSGEWAATVAALRGGVPLRVGCGTTIALSLLPAALAALCGRAGGAAPHLHIRAGDSAETAAGLLAGEGDAGLVTTAPTDRRLEAIPLLRDPLVVVGPPGAPAQLDLAALVAQPLCLYPRGTGFRTFLDERLGQAGLTARPAAEMDSLEALREMVAAGLGLSILPRSVVATALRERRLAAVRVPALDGAVRTISLLRHRGRAEHPAFGDLRAALVAAAARLEGSLAPQESPTAVGPPAQESPRC